MLTPAPSAVEKPTSRAVWEFEAIAAAKIGANEETVPSIISDQRRLHHPQHEIALVGQPRAVDQAREETGNELLTVCASASIATDL